jgi:hypothetical protein
VPSFNYHSKPVPAPQKLLEELHIPASEYADWEAIDKDTLRNTKTGKTYRVKMQRDATSVTAAMQEDVKKSKQLRHGRKYPDKVPSPTDPRYPFYSFLRKLDATRSKVEKKVSATVVKTAGDGLTIPELLPTDYVGDNPFEDLKTNAVVTIPKRILPMVPSGFVKCQYAMPKGQIATYRQDIPENSIHLDEYVDWWIAAVDRYNPRYNLLMHALTDALPITLVGGYALWYLYYKYGEKPSKKARR